MAKPTTYLLIIMIIKTTIYPHLILSTIYLTNMVFFLRIFPKEIQYIVPISLNSFHVKETPIVIFIIHDYQFFAPISILTTSFNIPSLLWR